MRNGLRVVDVDTHVTPSYETLMHYADPALKTRADELLPYVRKTQPAPGRGHPETEYGVLRINPRPYSRVAGRREEDPPPQKPAAGAAGSLEGRVDNLASKGIHVGVQHENSAGRLLDMDVEGVDINVIVPGTWAPGSTALDVDLATSLYEAYHRYMAEYCSADPRRLKGLVLAPAAAPEWAAKTIRDLADSDWVTAVWPVIPEGLPVDDPGLDPIWAAMNDADLPIIHHSFFYEPPYFPGYRDIWGNLAVARTAAHVWGAERLLAYVLVSGIFDRFPNLRVATIETGHGWLPHWLIRLTSQISYVKGAVPEGLRYTPLEYVEQGRVFCAIESHEGPEMTKAVIDLLGDGVLMYESDYPHPECHFPDSTDLVLAWQDQIGATAMRKLMGENAVSYLRLLSNPWDNPAPAERAPDAGAAATAESGAR